MKSSDKIVGVKKLQTKLKSHRRAGKRIAFTNGCFDILHMGHVAYLQKAKGRNRILVIGLNSDASTRRLKGRHRPVNPQKARACLLAALECVDYVTLFHTDTPLALIKAVAPDILIKGADWKKGRVVGGDYVRQKGGRVELIKYLPRFSTTKILKKIQSL